MATSAFLKLACAVFMCMVVVAPHAEAAITCSAVTKNIASCVAYLKGGSSPSDACCTGVKTLKNLASTPADKKTACNCLKSAASSIKGLVEKNAAALPDSCGVSISYSISPQTDCSKYVSVLSLTFNPLIFYFIYDSIFKQLYLLTSYRMGSKTYRGLYSRELLVFSARLREYNYISESIR